MIGNILSGSILVGGIYYGIESVINGNVLIGIASCAAAVAVGAMFSQPPKDNDNDDEGEE